MDPNSGNQRWSQWTWFIRPARPFQRTFNEVKLNLTKFTRLRFGSVSQMNIRQWPNGYLIQLITEGANINDSGFVEFIRRDYEHYFQIGFGLGTKVKMTAKLLAGSNENGAAAEQLVIMPFICDDNFRLYCLELEERIKQLERKG